jgi:alanine racemase
LKACAAPTALPARPGRGRARARSLGWRGPILLLEGVFEPRDLELCSRLGLWHAVHCDEQIDWLAAHKTQVPHRVFLKMNSGMNRLGFTPRALPRRLGAAERAAAGGRNLVMTHFSDADGPRGIAHQMAAFNTATATCPASAACATAPPPCATRQDAGVRADWVRAGIVVYGSAPDFPEHTPRTGACSPP